MTHFEYMQKQGQIDLFDILELQVSDQVRAIIYDDEMDYASTARPYLLETGEIVGIKLDFYYVAYGEFVEVIGKGKLMKA